MKHLHKRFLTGLTTVGVLSVVAGFFLFFTSTPRPAPEVVFKTITGERIAMADLRGKPVLINFWASTCGYCLQEMPHLAKLYREKSVDGLQLIGVAMPYDMPSHVIQVTKQLNLPYPIAIDPDDVVARAFGNVSMTPTSFLIDKDGMIIDKTTGRMNLDTLHNQINQLLRES
ncbi:MAG TPA: TlpA family protein disulfide reductase [Crenotrichaceae bacterium]|nr:TlpA family protein disulfide reductase [Crenotrichaceae bacterium]